jgi:hypothetical protein
MTTTTAAGTVTAADDALVQSLCSPVATAHRSVRAHEESRARHDASARKRRHRSHGRHNHRRGRRDDRDVRASTIDGTRVRETFGLMMLTSVFLDAIVITCCCHAVRANQRRDCPPLSVEVGHSDRNDSIGMKEVAVCRLRLR